MKFFFYTSCVLGILYLVLCICVYVYQERLIFYPYYLAENHIFEFRENFEEIYLLNNAPNDRLHALWFKHKKENLSQKVILYFHGNGGCLEGWGHVAPDFTHLGYDILIVDYRTYGKSRGKLSQKNLFDDAKIAFDFLKKHYKENDITIFGRSIGTGVATHLASQTKPERLILETPYNNFNDLLAYHAYFLPVSLLCSYPLRSDEYLKNVVCPVYIFHGTMDNTIPLIFGQKLAQNIPKENLVIIENGNHNNLATFPIYQKKLKKILTF